MSATTASTGGRPDWRRRLVYAILTVVAIVVVYTVLYRWAMAVYADVQVSFLHSLRIVVESLTTAGFGGDAHHWTSGPLHLLVIAMNLSGVLLVFLAIPLFVVPVFRQLFETRPPTTSSLTDHVIVCGYGSEDEVLGDELAAAGVPHLYVETDPDLVTSLNERGVDAILGDPERIETLESANASAARALVADVGDEVNPTVLLSADQIDPTLYTVSVVRDYQVEDYHRYAGADDVVLARQLLGKSLGMRATASYAEKFRDAIVVESDVRVTELLVERGSELVGQTLREASVLDRMGVTVIGAWLGGKFVVSPDPDTRIDENAILLVAGERGDFESMKARTIIHSADQPSHVVVCGYGTVGWSVVQTLQAEATDVDVTVVDREAKEGVDVVGDVADPETLREAGVDEARAVVFSLDDDTPTVYATLVVNQLAPDVEIIARASDVDTVWKLYNAGADFVLSLPSVTGEILASLLIEEVEILTPDTEFGFVRTDATAFDGRTLAELDLRARTGCTVVAVERDGELLIDLGGDFELRDVDTLIVAGSQGAQRRFRELARDGVDANGEDAECDDELDEGAGGDDELDEGADGDDGSGGVGDGDDAGGDSANGPQGPTRP